jgi:hypothetical protein
MSRPLTYWKTWCRKNNKISWNRRGYLRDIVLHLYVAVGRYRFQFQRENQWSRLYFSWFFSVFLDQLLFLLRFYVLNITLSFTVQTAMTSLMGDKLTHRNIPLQFIDYEPRRYIDAVQNKALKRCNGALLHLFRYPSWVIISLQCHHVSNTHINKWDVIFHDKTTTAGTHHLNIPDAGVLQ